MPEDTKSVPNQEPASSQEPVSPSAEPPKPLEPQAQPPQPLTEERIQQLIAEATQRAIEQGKQLGKREMQSIKDREVAEISRKARLAESKARAYDSSFANLDEDTRSALEQAKLKGENKYYQDVFQEEENRRNQEAYANQLRQSLKEEATALGIDPNDNRIDYALDEGDYFKGRQRFTGSLSKIIKANQDTATKQMQDNFKAMEMNLRKELGLDAVPPSSGAGVDTSEATFIKEYNAGLKNSSADHKRAREYLNKLNK